jgi:tetratricopeptide (TPR) repeat protein
VILNATGPRVSHFHSVPLGELPPPAPRDCFGREGLIEEVVGLAEKLEPTALIGAGGIGKTSVALIVLHHDRIKERFGENRKFIRCDQFPASRPHFLARLSEVIGAGVENPEDLTPLRPLLSSKEMFIILDNAESILDPKGSSADGIYAVVEELCQLNKVCLCITSRIMTVPPRCKCPQIPTLSMTAACNIFYGIYGGDGQPNIINDLLRRLDFHALSITLLATTASHNAWDCDRLAKEWDAQRAQVLQTHHNKSLAATIELSLASPTFHSLGPDARNLLEVVAFFPQGIDENNLDWLFPTISNRKNIFDGFFVLSLTHRSNGLVTMLAPIRDYLGPQDPRSSPLLCATRDRYFNRLSVAVYPDTPGFGEARWIVSEDLNVEHLLDVCASVDQNMDDVWIACYRFLQHILWHKPRQTVLKQRIEGLPDNHPNKPQCLFELSLLFQQIGNHREQKRLLVRTLELQSQRGVDDRVALTLTSLSDVNRVLGLRRKGIRQAREALKIYERIGGTIWKAQCLIRLAFLLLDNGQLNAAENAASRAIDLLPEKGREYMVVSLQRILTKVSCSKHRKEKAFHHFNTAIGIASPRNWHDQLFWIHLDMALFFRDEREYDVANTQIERAKLHAIDDAYRLGRAMDLQAEVWYSQHKLKDAKSEALHALENLEKCGAAPDAECCRAHLRKVEKAMKSRSTGSQGEFLETILHPTFINLHFLTRSTPSGALAKIIQGGDTAFLNVVPFNPFSEDLFYYTAHILWYLMFSL